MAKGGEPIHQIIEPNQKAKHTWEKQTKQKQQRFSNYSGHQTKGSYQKTTNTWEQQTNTKQAQIFSN